MKRTYYSHVRVPLVPGAGLVLGAAGRKDLSATRPDLCPSPDLFPFSGDYRCGFPFRPI